MKLEQQVCSLELAKKLRSLGVKQQSLFTYNQVFKGPETGFEEEWKLIYGQFNQVKRVSAFTVAELGEMLPKRLKNHWKIRSMYKFKRGTYVDLKIEYNERTKEWIVSYYGDTGFENSKDIYFHGEIAKTEADVRAKMLIYLIENKLITLN